MTTIGAGIICFFFGFFLGRNSPKRKKNDIYIQPNVATEQTKKKPSKGFKSSSTDKGQSGSTYHIN